MLHGAKASTYHPYGCTVGLAGSGVRGGQRIDSADAIGLHAEKNPVSVRDFHATVLHALGFRNDESFSGHDGRLGSLTGAATSAKVARNVFA